MAHTAAVRRSIRYLSHSFWTSASILGRKDHDETEQCRQDGVAHTDAVSLGVQEGG